MEGGQDGDIWDPPPQVQQVEDVGEHRVDHQPVEGNGLQQLSGRLILIKENRSIVIEL